MNDIGSIYDDDFEGDEGVIVNPKDVVDIEDSLTGKDNTENQFDNPNPNIPEGLFDDDGDDNVSVSYQNDDERDIIADLLNRNNINPEAISFEDEDGNITEKDFGELTYEEQLELLQFNYSEADSKSEDDEKDVSDDELNLIKYLRTNNKSVNDLLSEREADVISRYEKEQPLSIDSYSDEELYVYDIATRLPNLSDEDIEARLDVAMANKDLFEKEVSSLRDAYTKAEQDDKERVLVENQTRIAKAEEQKKTKFQDVLERVNSFADEVVVEDSDKEELMRYALNKDVEGKTPLENDLADEEKLFQIAFLSKFGGGAIDVIKSNYEKRIKEAENAAYRRGKSEAIDGMPSKPRSAYRPKSKTKGKSPDENILGRKLSQTEMEITGGRLSSLSSMYD